MKKKKKKNENLHITQKMAQNKKDDVKKDKFFF